MRTLFGREIGRVAGVWHVESSGTLGPAKQLNYVKKKSANRPVVAWYMRFHTVEISWTFISHVRGRNIITNYVISNIVRYLSSQVASDREIQCELHNHISDLRSISRVN